MTEITTESHLQYNKFKQSFQDTLNPFYSCSPEVEKTHFVLHCPNFPNNNHNLLKNLYNIENSFRP